MTARSFRDDLSPKTNPCPIDEFFFWLWVGQQGTRTMRWGIDDVRVTESAFNLLAAQLEGAH